MGRTEKRTDTARYIAPNGSVHSAELEIYAKQIVIPFHVLWGQWCVEGRVTTESSNPGASGNTWTGELYLTEASIDASDVLDFLRMDLSAFYALYNPVEPDRSIRAQSPPPVSHTCVTPCMGGTLQTKHIIVDPRHIKTKAIYFYGTHNVTTPNTTPFTMQTFAMLKVEVKASRSFFERMLGIGVEIAMDVGRDLADRIVEWLKAKLLSGGD